MTFTNVEIFAMKDDAERYIKRHTITELAQKAGVGAKVIDNLLKENFEAITDQHLQQIYRIVNTDYKHGLYRTTDCQAFLKAADRAIKHKLMIGLTGGTGSGKSFLSQAIAKKENVFYWNCELMKSPREFYSALAGDLKCHCYGSISNMIDQVATAFNSLENPLLIIDEGDKMHRTIRSCLKTLRDRTIDNMGILIVGMPDFKNALVTGKETGKPGCAEFFRRVNLWHHMDGLRPEEIKHVLRDAGITEPEQQREFKRYTSFGELVNAIELHKLLND